MAAKKKSDKNAGKAKAAEPKPPVAAPAVPAPKPSPDSRIVPIVGIGASAGGLDAFKKLFAAMPADSGAGFVLIPHLDPKHESLMVELLSRHTKMPVIEAE